MSKKDRVWDIKEVESMDVDSLLLCKERISLYPYCQYAQLLYLLNLKKLEDGKYEQVLPFTAISMPERARLKEHIDALAEFENQKEENTENERQPIFSPWSEVLARPRKVSGSLPKRQTEDTQAPKNESSNNNIKKFKERLEELGSGTATQDITRKLHVAESVPEEVRQTAEKTEKKAKVKTKTQEPGFSEKEKEKLNKKALVERFISQPAAELLIRPDNDKDYSVDADTKQSLAEDISIGTETLAGLFVKQGKPEKAIEIYKNLTQKHPEKSKYYAKLVRDTKKKINKS